MRVTQPDDIATAATGAARSPTGPVDLTAQHLGLIILPGFAMGALASALEVIDEANRQLPATVYRVRLWTTDGMPVRSQGWLSVAADSAMNTKSELDFLIVYCEEMPDERLVAEILPVIRYYNRHGVAICGVAAGALLLARAGIHEGRRWAVKWSYRDAFTELYPYSDLSLGLYEVHDQGFTCVGGHAFPHAVLNLIERRFGSDIAARIAFKQQLGPMRRADDVQPHSLHLDAHHLPSKLRQMIALMAENLEEPMPRGDIARTVGLSSRQMERLFVRYLKVTPKRYYNTLRLERARNLLRQTDMSLAEIAVACGFETPTGFSKTYRKIFGCQPRQDRKAAIGNQWPATAVNLTELGS
jgi:transcriptional regulator GlxA family with amidase domain